MYGHSPIFSEKDERVKVYLNNSAVSASLARINYARYPNYSTDFSVTEATHGTIKTYDIGYLYTGKVIPYEGGVAKGTTPGFLNFDPNQFDVSSISGGQYTVTSTGRVKVNSISTIRPLNVVNTTNHTAVTAADNSGTDKIDLTFSNNDVDVLSNGTLVNTSPRRINFSTDFTATDNSASDRVDIALAANYIPATYSKRWGSVQWSTDGNYAGEGLLSNSFVTNGSPNSTPRLDVDGGYRELACDTDDEYIGFATDDPITRRSWNPHLWGAIKLPSVNSFRVFIGWHSTDPLPQNNNTFLDNAEGFGLTAQTDTSPDTQWRIRRNDGDATTDSTSTGVNITANTLLTFELKMDSTSCQWNVNGGAFTSYITEIPAVNTDLLFTARIEEIGGTDQSMNLYYLFMIQDK